MTHQSINRLIELNSTGENGKNMSSIFIRHIKVAVLNIGLWDLNLPFLISRSYTLHKINNQI